MNRNQIGLMMASLFASAGVDSSRDKMEHYSDKKGKGKGKRGSNGANRIKGARDASLKERSRRRK